MSSSDDDHDDVNSSIFDQLKSIKAFTVDQLYLLHPDVGCPPTSSNSYGEQQYSDDKAAGQQLDHSGAHHDQNLYQNLIEYEQLREKLAKIKAQVRQLERVTFDNVGKIWVFTEETPRKIGMCQQGKIAETTFKYKRASINSKKLDDFNLSFTELSELIGKEYVYYSFESQMKRCKIATQLSMSYQISDLESRMIRLKSSIITLIDFIKHLGDSKSDFVLQCQRWLRGLIKRFLEQKTTDDYRFIIAQLSKGPAGTADWSADLVEYRPHECNSEFELTPQYVSQCCALLSELFISLKSRIRRMTISTTDNIELNTSNDYTDHNWSLIDPRFNCSEELNLAGVGNTLSESDVTKFCLRIPVTQIFKVYVKKCLDSSEFRLETDKNYEYIMLKLLTMGTMIIKTYQTGLEVFNSIQYGTLIEYLSSQIRRTVIVLSDQWNEFKRRLRGVDNALMMRLQVEYDNFILRSILIILELRQCGIWRHLSRIEQDDVQTNEGNQSWSAESLHPAFTKLLQVTGLTTAETSSSQPAVEGESGKPLTQPANSPPSSSLTYGFSIEWFKEVSEPMLWHILWQLYHNAFVNSCDYHSDNYWLPKFKENSSIYLFVNKMKDSPPGECSYMLNSVTSMLLSRTRLDSKLVSFIAAEIFNLSFRHKQLKEKIAKKGIRSLIRCAEKFPNLVSLFIRFIVEEEFDEDIVVLIKGCSLTGWIFNDDELEIISTWLIECALSSSRNKVARLIISKLLLNSPELRPKEIESNDDSVISLRSFSRSSRRPRNYQCFVDLRLRRRLTLLLYQASIHHLPENNDFGPRSLGASVEVAFLGLFCEGSSVLQTNLLDLAVDSSYQQLYVWIWRLLFTFRLHILNQPETDWNDVQSRSGTSRSIKNTVLLNDSFHPVPSIQDSECLSLSEGVENQNPIASFIYLSMTDVTWQADTLDSCLTHLHSMANSGHLTPSLMAVKFLTTCHLNDLSDIMTKDSRVSEYFVTILTSNFESTRLASLIISQLQHLKQYRQLQLSQFYISVLLRVAAVILKQLSSSWFSGHEHNLEKVACLLDYIVKFNFTTQRLEIIRKFYDCSYSIQGCKPANGWFGSFFNSNSLNANSTKREFLTTLHILTQKFKKYTWLRWVTTECDTLRLEKLWEDIVGYLSTNEEANLDSAIKKVCPQINPTILKSTLPIYSWIGQIFDIVESDLSHPLCPLIWYNFYLNYFANSLNGVSVGLKLVPHDTQTKLLSRLDSLFNYHLYKHRYWASTSTLHQNSLAQLYRAYRLWLQDCSLQDAYVDIDRLREDYLVPLLKAVMESSVEGVCLQYIDIQSIETQNRNLSQVWSIATKLEGNTLIKEMIFVDSNQDDSMEILTSVDDEASDAVSLIVKPFKSLPESNKMVMNIEEELNMPMPMEKKFQGAQETIDLVKRYFHTIFEESSIYGLSMAELEKLKTEISDLIQHLYVNKKREHIRVVSCADGTECAGPAIIKFEVEEATLDDRKNECIQDRQRQCEELISEVLIMPTSRAVQSAIFIEDCIKELIQDASKAKLVIETLLKWISEPKTYKKLNGSYHVANHLLKFVLEILSNTEEVDTYNANLIDVCFDHPGSVQLLSPHLSPSRCSTDCFINLYKKISAKHISLGPIATFVLLSKFDVDSWLKRIRKKELHHDIIKTTCAALRDMGKQTDDSFLLTFDIYRRHIQVELAQPDRCKPEEISIVLSKFLAIMDDQSLAPSLWNDFMSILGLEKQASSSTKGNKSQQINPNTSLSSASNKSVANEISYTPLGADCEHDEATITSIIEDIARLADCQLVFDYNSLQNLMQILTDFMIEKDGTSDVNLLEQYQDYLEQFSLVMLSVSFMWIKSIGDRYPDNHSLIWTQFMKFWNNWVYLSKNCQNVKKSSYSLISSLYVAAIRYMIFRIPDNIQLILQSVLSSLTEYIQVTKEVVYLELSILQRSLGNLPWSSLLISVSDVENLAALSEQANYNVSDLVSHILLQVNIKESLMKINEKDHLELSHFAERLATTIVLQSTHLKGFRLHGSFFILIPVDQISKIASLILPRMEFVNLEHSQNNKLLVNLLRFMCIKLDVRNDINLSQLQASDSFDRSIIYARFVSNYLVDLIKNRPTVVKYHEAYLHAVMDNSLQDLKLLVSPDVDRGRKVAIYESLLECFSSEVIEEESRLFIARSLIKSSLLENRPIVVMEVFHAIGQIISDARVLVYIVERMINLYLKMNGHYEKVWKSFCLKVLPSDLYLEACLQEGAPLALLVYFEALSKNGQDSQENADNTSTSELAINTNQIWSSFFHWISKMTMLIHVNGSNQSGINDTKLPIVWLRLLTMLEHNLDKFCHRLTHNKPIAEQEEGKQEGESTDSSPPQSLQHHQQQQHQRQQGALISVVEFIKQLISLYDSCNAGGLWSYLKSTRTEQTSRVSIIALAVACFLADKTYVSLRVSVNNRKSNEGNYKTPANFPAMHDEIIALRKTCLTKLEAARKSKYYLDYTSFIEALIESVNRNDKVEYSEGVQLIVTFVKSIHNLADPSDYIYINKILASFNE